jgi:hypothetical protein
LAGLAGLAASLAPGAAVFPKLRQEGGMLIHGRERRGGTAQKLNPGPRPSPINLPLLALYNGLLLLNLTATGRKLNERLARLSAPMTLSFPAFSFLPLTSGAPCCQSARRGP